MRTTHDEGGYGYTPGGLDFASNGVTALPGSAIDHAALTTPVPMRRGFDLVRDHLDRVRRPVAALCGMELRLPATLSADEFAWFNDEYLGHLAALGLGTTPAPALTRTNVAPVAGAPDVPSVSAFSYTVADDTAGATFVLSGVAELPEGAGYPAGVVRRGESGAAALADKARCVIDVVAGRVGALGASWDPSVAVHLYTAHDLTSLVAERLPAPPAHGLVWHRAYPPAADLELEIDLRRYRRELLLSTMD
jgi:hypothetical protein